jgi:hypothetical protein
MLVHSRASFIFSKSGRLPSTTGTGGLGDDRGANRKLSGGSDMETVVAITKAMAKYLGLKARGLG